MQQQKQVKPGEPTNEAPAFTDLVPPDTDGLVAKIKKADTDAKYIAAQIAATEARKKAEAKRKADEDAAAAAQRAREAAKRRNCCCC